MQISSKISEEYYGKNKKIEAYTTTDGKIFTTKKAALEKQLLIETGKIFNNHGLRANECGTIYHEDMVSWIRNNKDFVNFVMDYVRDNDLD